MLNYIRYHLHDDEQLQQAIEAEHGAQLQQNLNRSIDAFERHLPNLGQFLRRFSPQTTSVFLNKHAQQNIVNFSTGKVLYPLDVDQQIQRQIEHWQLNAAYVHIDESIDYLQVDSAADFDKVLAYKDAITASAKHVDTLAILGLGKGTHLLELYETFLPKQIIVYEADLHQLYCSAIGFDWAAFLTRLHEDGVMIFMQLPNDGSSLPNDLMELKQNLAAQSQRVEHVLVFQHTRVESFNKLMQNMRNPAQVDNSSDQYLSAVPYWVESVNIDDWQPLTGATPIFKQNMLALEKYYPDLYAAYKDFTPKVWQPLIHKHTGEISLFNRIHLCLYSPNPQTAAQSQVAEFSKYPNRESLVMGYAGNKLNHFFFNQFYNECGAVLASQAEEKSQLPEEVPVLMLFGIGNAYLPDEIFKTHRVQNVLLNEPNPEYFYWSLLVSDWARIFKHIDENAHHIYLNIGQLDANLISQYTYQFALIGNHLITHSYLLQGYESKQIQEKLAELRNTLSTLFAISDNFDHSFYGLSHFMYSIDTQIPYLNKTVETQNKAFAQHPVFIVGNGPSLDQCIAQIKASSDEAIIVSCGTALKTLHAHGIRPDFHAEIELYRANYDWISRVDDEEYLKQITLISVDGVHPDNTALFKDTLLAFKNGEASTSITKYLLKDFPYLSLQAAYPTVSNFALSLFAHAGFKEVYLFGVDLGFKDPEIHHSQASGYYNKGRALFKTASNGEGPQHLLVPGNFCDQVLTKFEFRLSKTMLEQLTGQFSIDCYNCSDGAKIENTTPLPVDDVFVVKNAEQKRLALQAFKQSFSPIPLSFIDLYNEHFEPAHFSSVLDALLQALPTKFAKTEDVFALSTHYTSGKLFDTQAGEIFFHVLFSSTKSCFLAALGKVTAQQDDANILRSANYILNAWRDLLKHTKSLFELPAPVFDRSVAFPELREEIQLNQIQAKQAEIPIVFSFDHAFRSLLKRCSEEADEIFNFVDEIDTPDLDNAIIVVQSEQEMSQLFDALPAIVASKALILTSDRQVFESLLTVCRASYSLSCLYYDYLALLRLNDTLSYFLQGKLAIPDPQYLCHDIIARFKQREAYSAMLMKPRFNMAPYIRTRTSDDVHPNQFSDFTELKQILNNQGNILLFKHFVAISRVKIETGTVLDCYKNRGVLINRPLYSGELSDYGYYSVNISQITERLEELQKRV
ncbi:motility associated factor glycosyltransferase family protein [Agaribacter flavus]|uniref:6-hydroxymethylpterin diphosphokinase MptE-like protein n=1 Tax=Agaribacter flavus TaxID=1902781 RepID=A0ABV7FNH0_9ALTE